MSWRMQFFAPPKASGPAYVRDGLVLWLDGIWNAGKGVHDPNATTWTNLVDGQVLGPSAIFDDDSAIFDKGRGSKGIGIRSSYAKEISTLIASGVFAVEACASAPDVSFSPSSCFLGTVFANGWTINLLRISANTGLGSVSTANVKYGRETVYLEAETPFATISATAAGDEVTTYRDASRGGSARLPAPIAPQQLIAVGASSDGSQNELFAGRIHSVRIYSRALSPDEIRQNYEVDKERFHL